MGIKCSKCHFENPNGNLYCCECGTMLPLMEGVFPEQELHDASQDIACNWNLIKNTDKGPIVKVIFHGIYPPGGQGNPHAAVMFEYLRQVVSKENPAAVLIDLTELKYTFGNSIGGIAYTLGSEKKDGLSIIPACVVAKGETAKALSWFFEDSQPLKLVYDMGLFTSNKKGIEFLEKKLTITTSEKEKI